MVALALCGVLADRAVTRLTCGDPLISWRFRSAQDVRGNTTTSSAPLRGASLRSLRDPRQRGVPPLVQSPAILLGLR